MAREVKKTKKRKYNKQQPQPKKKNPTLHNDIMAVIIIFAGLILAISMFGGMGKLGVALKTALTGLLGVPAYLLCLAMIACSIHYIVKKQSGRYVRKYVFVAVFIVLLSAFWHIVERITVNQGFVGMTKSLWLTGINGNGGGVIGGWLGVPLESLTSWGSIVILVAIMLILFLCIFEISIADTIEWIKDKCHRE